MVGGNSLIGFERTKDQRRENELAQNVLRRMQVFIGEHEIYPAHEREERGETEGFGLYRTTSSFKVYLIQAVFPDSTTSIQTVCHRSD